VSEAGAPSVLMPQDRPGLPAANFRIILCGRPLPCRRPTPTGPGGSGQTSPLNVRRIGGVTLAENLALESAPMTQEPHRNQDSRGSGAHYFCHAKYTHVSQTLWRGLKRVSEKTSFLGGWVNTADATAVQESNGICIVYGPDAFFRSPQF
jgi:hypothetical protein